MFPQSGQILPKCYRKCGKYRINPRFLRNSPNAAAAPKSFDDVMSVAKSAFTEVNHLQAQSEKVRDAYISGDSSVSMSQVVMASEKSKLAFEGLVTVRNKILEAYKEIMNMPV